MKIKYLGFVLVLLFTTSCESPQEQVEPPQQQVETPKYMVIHRQGALHLVYIEKTDYMQVANLVCGQKRICIVMFWNHPAKVPTKVPMTDAQVATSLAHYSFNINTARRRLIVN